MTRWPYLRYVTCRCSRSIGSLSFVLCERGSSWCSTAFKLSDEHSEVLAKVHWAKYERVWNSPIASLKNKPKDFCSFSFLLQPSPGHHHLWMSATPLFQLRRERKSAKLFSLSQFYMLIRLLLTYFPVCKDVYTATMVPTAPLLGTQYVGFDLGLITQWFLGAVWSRCWGQLSRPPGQKNQWDLPLTLGFAWEKNDGGQIEWGLLSAKHLKKDFFLTWTFLVFGCVMLPCFHLLWIGFSAYMANRWSDLIRSVFCD